MQDDDNFAIYTKNIAGVDVPLWSTETNGHSGAWAQFNPDGNFVIYEMRNNKPKRYLGSVQLFKKVSTA